MRARIVVFSEKDEYRTLLGYPKDEVELSTIDVTKITKKKSQPAKAKAAESGGRPPGVSGIGTKGRGY